MTVETFAANFYQVETDSTLGTTALIISVPSTAGSPAVPFYGSLEPDNASQREVLKISSKTATQFTIDDISDRYLDGSAAGSGLTHPSGSVLRISPLAQHLADIWDRIGEITHTEDHASRHANGGADSISGSYVPKTGGTFTGAVIVSSGGATITGNVTITGDVALSGGTSDLSVGGNLTVTGTTTFTGAPSYASDPGSGNVLSRKTYVDTQDTAHADLTSPHSAVSTNTVSRLVVRDASARARFADPSAAQDAATKNYVDARTIADILTPVVTQSDDTTLSFGSNSTWTTGSPSVIAEFVGPSTGKVLIGSSCLVNNGGISTATLFFSGYRLGTTSAGDEVQGENTISRCMRLQIFTTTPGFIGNTPMLVPVTGLTPGTTYYATWRGQHPSGAGGPLDVRNRRIIVIPVT